MDVKPLDVELPLVSVVTFKKKARFIQGRVTLPDGSSVKLSAVHNLLARCLGYPNFSGIPRGPNRAIWAIYGDSDAERRTRQDVREFALFRAEFSHMKEKEISQLLSKLRLVNWARIDKSFRLNSTDPRETEKGAVADRRPLGGTANPPTTSGPGVGAGNGNPFALFKTTAAASQAALTEADLFVAGCPLSDAASEDSSRRVSGAFLPPPTPCFYDTGSWKTLDLEPDLAFVPPTLWFATEKAKALLSLRPDISHECAFAMTARLFGFEDWFKLEECLRRERRSQFDEEMAVDRRRERHQWQVSALQICAGCTRLDAVGLRLDWLPTSGNMALLQRPTVLVRMGEQTPRDANARSRILGKIVLRRQSL